MTATEYIKERGFKFTKSAVEVHFLGQVSRQTLDNWAKQKAMLLRVVIEEYARVLGQFK